MGEGFLADFFDHGFGCAVFSETSKQEKSASYSLFAGIEKLVNQSRMISDVAREQICHVQIRERAIPLQRKYQCISVDLQKRAVRHCGRRVLAQRLSSQAPVAEKVSLAQHAEGNFLAKLRYDGKSNLAFMDVKDWTCRVFLREDNLFLGDGHDFYTVADRCKDLA
jgi:hypothetical protein